MTIAERTASAVAAARRPHSFVSQFVNIMMKNSGLRETAEKKMTLGLFELQKKTKNNPEVLFKKAIDNIKPVIMCKSASTGAKLHRIPIPLNEKQSLLTAFKWFAKEMQKKKRPAAPFEKRFSNEVLNVLEGKSSLLQKKAEVHKEALAHRAQVNMRWM
jgi:small subunit ribosomal protein S7